MDEFLFPFKISSIIASIDFLICPKKSMSLAVQEKDNISSHSDKINIFFSKMKIAYIHARKSIDVMNNNYSQYRIKYMEIKFIKYSTEKKKIITKIKEK